MIFSLCASGMQRNRAGLDLEEPGNQGLAELTGSRGISFGHSDPQAVSMYLKSRGR